MSMGLAYTASVNALLENSQGTKPTFETLKALLNGNSFAPTNYLLRASILNQDALAEKIQGVVGFDLRTIPWDQPNSVYKGMLEHLGQAANNVIARFIVNTMGPMIDAANATLNGTTKLAMIATGLHTGGWKLIEFQGNKRELYKTITRMVIESAKTPLSSTQIHRAAEIEMHRARIRGVKFKDTLGKMKVRWLVGLNVGAAGLGNVHIGLDALHYQRFEKVVSKEIKLGAAASALQFWCITKTIADFENAMDADKTENGWRLMGSALGITGGVMELCSDILERSKQYRVPRAVGIPGYVIQRVRFVGKALGIIGALIAAVWDLRKAAEEHEKGNLLVKNLFIASAGLGVAASVMLAFFASNPFTWLVVGLFIVVTYWLDRTKDNAIQSWLESCVFGKRPSVLYDLEPERELEEYRKVMS
jgi:hypothetical protein